MIDALISGKLHGDPVARKTKAGNDYLTAKLRVPTVNGDSLFANVVCFDQGCITTLQALSNGDPVCLVGTLTAGAWLDKNGDPRPSVDVNASGVLSPYSVKKKREQQQEG